MDASGPGGIRLCPGFALADLGDVEGFDRDGAEDKMYAFQLADGVYKRKEITIERLGAPSFAELSDVDTSRAVPRRVHTLAYTGDKWFTFTDPVKQTGWLIDIKITSPYVATGKQHKVRKVVNSGTMLCSYVPETKNVVVQEAPDKISNVIKTGNDKRGVLTMVCEFTPQGIIGSGLPTPSAVLLELILGDQTSDLVDVLPGFKIRWGQQHADKRVGLYIIVKEAPRVGMTLSGIQNRVDRDALDIKKIFLGPTFSLERLRYTHKELTPEDIAIIFHK